jgi:predicted nucleic acid-binding protein
MRYLLDSSFAIDYLRGEPAAIDRFELLFEEGDDACVNDVVVCEVVTGAPSPGDPRLDAFLRALEFIQPGPETAITAGRWRADARRAGRTINVPDALIAATAHATGAVVLTRNLRDFEAAPARVAAY